MVSNFLNNIKLKRYAKKELKKTLEDMKNNRTINSYKIWWDRSKRSWGFSVDVNYRKSELFDDDVIEQ